MTQRLAGHIRSVLFAFVILTLAGVGSALKLPVSLFPHIDFPRVVVSVDAGDRAADQMAAEVTRPLEEALRGVPGVTDIRSTTSRGSADISLRFAWGQDMVAALLQAQSAVSNALPNLPPGVGFHAKRLDPTVFPVLGLSATSARRDPMALRTFVDQQLRPLIAATPGVAGVEVLGGGEAEYQVILDPARTRALGLTVEDVGKALAANNTLVAAGRLEDRHRLYLTLIDDRLKGVTDIGQVVVKTGSTAGAGVVPLSSIAEIRLAPVQSWTRVTAQGRDSVLINIRQAPDADSVALVKAVRARLAKAHVPADVKMATYYDQTELVTGAAASVRDAILLGAILAGAVLFLFLRSLRLMAITAIMLPAVLAVTCLILLALHMSFNMMTLGGMAAAVGLVVDDGVVMLEHLVRRLEDEAGRSPGETKTALLAAAGEMIRPLIGSSLSTVVVFVPLAFLTGVTGGFFRALAVTMAAALLISLAFALFIAPVLARSWLRDEDVEKVRRAETMMTRLSAGYHRAAQRSLARPGLTVAATLGVFVIVGALAYTQLGSGFMPRMDEGGFILDYKAKPGAALSETDRLLRQVEAIIRATPDVDTYSRRTGAQLGGGLTESDEGDFFIHLKKSGRRDIETVMADIRNQVQAKVPGLDIETAQLMEDLVGDLTAVPQPIEIKLFGPNPMSLNAAAGRVAIAIGKTRGVVEVRDGLRVAGDAIVVKVNRPAAALEGLDPDAVTRQVQALMGADVVTRVQRSGILLGVRVMADPASRNRVESLSGFDLKAPDGHTVPLANIAQVAVERGQQQITRENLQPFVDVTGRLEGRDLGGTMTDVRQTVRNLHLPAEIRVEYGGLYAEQQKSFADLAAVFVTALMLVTLLLLILFERWAVATSVLIVVLLAAAAVFVGLWATGTELNISAMMGLTMVIGIVGELAIFYFAEFPSTGDVDRATLLAAGEARLRPIIMSAVIAILALSPLAFGLGEGSALQKPLAIAIISGLIAGAPLVLLVLPALYAVLSGNREAAG